MSIRNLDAVFAPRSIVLVGSADGPNAALDAIGRHLAAGGFAGPVMRADAPGSNALGRLATAPDLAVIATPPAAVPRLVADLAAQGCRAAVVVCTGMAADLARRCWRPRARI